jgi:hypothetical protein
VDNIKIDLVEMGLGGVDRIGLVQYTDKWIVLMNAVISLRVL